MFRLIDNSNYMINSGAVNNSSLDLFAYADAVGRSNAANELSQVSSGAWYFDIYSMFTTVNVSSATVGISGNIGFTFNCSLNLEITNIDGTVSLGNTNLTHQDSAFQRFDLEIIPSSVGTDGFRLRLNGGTLDDALSRSFRFSDFVVTVNSYNFIEFEPEYDYKEDHKKMESRHRTKAGREYVYKWGEYRQFKMGTMYVTSYQKSVINSYWNNNTELMFVQSGNLEVNSVLIMSSTLPVGSLIKPYNDLFKGTIELGTY